MLTIGHGEKHTAANEPYSVIIFMLIGHILKCKSFTLLIKLGYKEIE